MIELKRINDICPVCGKKFKTIKMKFTKGYCLEVKAMCECGYLMKTNSYYKTSWDGHKFTLMTESEDAIDKWNKVNHE